MRLIRFDIVLRQTDVNRTKQCRAISCIGRIARILSTNPGLKIVREFDSPASVSRKYLVNLIGKHPVVVNQEFEGTLAERAPINVRNI
jgi:hypothetical protein